MNCISSIVYRYVNMLELIMKINTFFFMIVYYIKAHFSTLPMHGVSTKGYKLQNKDTANCYNLTSYSCDVNFDCHIVIVFTSAYQL